MAAMDDSTSNTTQVELQLQDDSVTNEPSMLEVRLLYAIDMDMNSLLKDRN